MKKIAVILLVTLLAGSISFAQKGKVASALTYLENGDIEKAWQAIQIAEKNEKTVNWYRTYYVKGRILQSIAESKDPKIKNTVDDPLIKAFDSYQKANKLDEKGRIEKTIEVYLPMLNNDFIQKAVQEFQNKEYKASMESFDYALKVGKDKVFGGVVDTSLIYNAGLAAYNGKLWDDAIDYLTKAKDMEYGGGTTYVLLKNSYLEKEDTAGGLKVLQEGFNKHPADKTVIFELINFYLLTVKDSQAAMDYINRALKQDPENTSLYFAKGLAMDKLGQHDSAVAAYKVSISKDSTFLNSYYNLGALIFNDGVAMFNKCNKIMDNEKFKKCVDSADIKFRKALPYLERAHVLDPKEVNTMETLKVLYYRLHMYNKRDKIIKEINALKGGGSNENK